MLKLTYLHNSYFKDFKIAWLCNILILLPICGILLPASFLSEQVGKVIAPLWTTYGYKYLFSFYDMQTRYFFQYRKIQIYRNHADDRDKLLIYIYNDINESFLPSLLNEKQCDVVRECNMQQMSLFRQSIKILQYCKEQYLSFLFI